MFRTFVLAAALACACAFQAPRKLAGRTNSVAVEAEMSKSLPFLEKPEKLDGSMVRAARSRSSLLSEALALPLSRRKKRPGFKMGRPGLLTSSPPPPLP